MSEERELEAIWREHRDQTLARVAGIRAALGAARTWEADDPQRDFSRAEAHTLAGGAAIFGAREAARLARDLEDSLSSAAVLNASDLTALDAVASQLESALRDRR